MPRLLLPGRAQVQPQSGYAIDRSNPITAGLVAAITPVAGKMRDVVNSVNGVVAGWGSMPMATCPQGRVATTNSGDKAHLDFVHPIFGTFKSTGYTHLLLALPTELPTWGSFFATHDGANGIGLSIRRNENTNNFDLIQNDALGGIVGIGSSGSELARLSDGRLHTFAASALGTSAKLYIDGVVAASGSIAYPATIASPRLVMGLAFNGEEGASGRFGLHLVWQRRLADWEIRSLHQNPWQVFGPSTRRLLVEAAAASGTFALTGVSATGAVGTVAPSTSKALTGNAGTAAVGTVTPATSKALTGNAGTGAVGSVTPVRAGALTGNAGTGSPGTVTPTTTAAITGNAATAAVGSVTPVRSGAITGDGATGAVGTVVPNITIALTGVSATGAVGTVSPVTGSDPQLTGVSGTSAVGTVSPATSKALTGNVGTGSPGTVAPSTDIALTGNAATGAAGSVTPVRAGAITGNVGTGSPGTVAPSTSKAITGNESTGSVGSVSPNVTVALTGVSATGHAGNVSVSVPGQAAISGVAATGAAGTVGAAVTIALSGVSATAAVGQLGASISITLTGASAAANAGTLVASGGGLTVLGSRVGRPLERFSTRSNVQTSIR